MIKLKWHLNIFIVDAMVRFSFYEQFVSFIVAK